MSIGLTTVILFAVLESCFFKLPHFRKHRDRIDRCCHVFSFMGSDHVYHHAENEQRC